MAGNRPIIIRTYYGDSDASLMGQWGIIYSMANEEVFITQLRAGNNDRNTNSGVRLRNVINEVIFTLSDKLLQYIMAIGARSPAVLTLNDPMHPAINI